MRSGGLIVGAMLWLPVMVVAPPVLAGDLNPPGSPAPTMKTLDEIPGSWDRVLSAAERFKLVMPTIADPSGEAVMDKETGLVWEKSPNVQGLTMPLAREACFNKRAGGRKGWRLPTIEELASLVDPLVVPDPNDPNPRRLPTGHPFLNIQPVYWSETTVDGMTGSAYFMGFISGATSVFVKSTQTNVWCVRGGRGHEGQ